MFRSIFLYWSNITDTPAIQAKLNMFFYMNIRIFKIKLNNYISFAIHNLSFLKYKKIKIFYNVLNFELLYFKFLTSCFLLIIFLFLI